MPVRFTILGSGSGGNCAYLESDETRILIDAGFSGRQIRERLASIGRAPEGLNGILITHEHGDHITGLGALCGKVETTIYTNRFTQEAITRQFPDTRFRFARFETGASFTIGNIGIDTFSVPHDAADPVGFLITTPEVRIGFLTDLGHVTKLVMERVRPSQVLVLEANHDLQLLRDDTRRPWSTKQRILSRHGHLSNDAAAEAAAGLAHAGLERIYLGHLSRDCNRPELAREAVARKLREIGAAIRLESTSQEAPCATVAWGETPPAA